MTSADYNRARDIVAKEYGFRSLIMAAMIMAAPHDLIRLKSVFPRIWDDWWRSYHIFYGGFNLQQEGEHPC